MAQPAEMTVADELHVSSFPDRFPYYACTAAQSAHFIGSRVYACLGVTCHLHFWQNDRVAHKVNSGEENSPAAPAGIGTRNFSMTSPVLLPTSYPG